MVQTTLQKAFLLLLRDARECVRWVGFIVGAHHVVIDRPRIVSGCSCRAGRAGRRAANVLTRAEEVVGGRAVRRVFVFVHRPLLLGGLNLLHVGHARFGVGALAGLDEIGNGDGEQDTDDEHHDHNLNEREAAIATTTAPCLAKRSLWKCSR